MGVFAELFRSAGLVLLVVSVPVGLWIWFRRAGEGGRAGPGSGVRPFRWFGGLAASGLFLMLASFAVTGTGLWAVAAGGVVFSAGLGSALVISERTAR